VDDDEDDGASVSSYKTGHEKFEDNEDGGGEYVSDSIRL
jgi:hypothetical protein